MDHVVYLDAQANELENLLKGAKTMIIRGATGRKLPYGRVNKGDVLYFINNNGEGIVRAKAVVSSVFNSDKLSPQESKELVEKHQASLQLSAKQISRWAGKRYLVLIEVEEVVTLKPISIDKSSFGNMDDWLPVESINKVQVP